MLAILQGGAFPNPRALVVGLVLLLAAVAWLILSLVRRFFKDTRDAAKERMDAAPRVENTAAFMTASMQGVIQKLRDQEKELERLHRIEKERAEHTERLSEEVTRNMPAGFLMVNATGIISGANPAAEQALGIHGLNYRRYSEALKEGSELTRLVSDCLAEGKIFRREQVNHRSPAGDESAAGSNDFADSPRQRENQWGDLPAERFDGTCGVAATDRTEKAPGGSWRAFGGDCARIQECAGDDFRLRANDSGGVRGRRNFRSAERILEQTRNITHVVTEFLKYARPLEISDEVVELEGSGPAGGGGDWRERRRTWRCVARESLAALRGTKVCCVRPC